MQKPSKQKIIISQSCYLFGAFETANKLSQAGDQSMLINLVDHLIEMDMLSSAFLVAEKHLTAKNFRMFIKEFKPLGDKDISKSRLLGSMHYKLTGEKHYEQEEKDEEEYDNHHHERSYRRNQGRGGNGSRHHRSNHESGSEYNNGPRNRQEQDYLTLEDCGFTRENYFFVRTARSFNKVRDHFIEKSEIGFSAQVFDGDKLSTISLASKKLLAVFDMDVLRKDKEVVNYIKDILMDEDIDILAHSFNRFLPALIRGLGIKAEMITRVLEISRLAREGPRGTIGLRQFTNRYLGKDLNTYYNKADWSARPISQECIDYAGLLAVMTLIGFVRFERKNPDALIEYMEVRPPRQNFNFRGGGRFRRNDRGGYGRNYRRNRSEEFNREGRSEQNDRIDHHGRRDDNEDRDEDDDRRRMRGRGRKYSNQNDHYDKDNHQDSRNHRRNYDRGDGRRNRPRGIRGRRGDR